MEKIMAVALVFVVACGCTGSVASAAEAPSVAAKCSGQFQKVAVCLSYATGKAETPTKECCDSVKGIRESEPECLCYVMQQANSGSEEIKKMGIQVPKLLQLPTACSLKNASASNCPKLLGIPPGSPEASIFTTNASSTTTTPAVSGQSAPDTSGGDSIGISKFVSNHFGLLAMAVSIFFFAFPFRSEV